MDLNGQAALVTGGASGLGAATARALAAAGAHVAILDRDLPGAKTLAAEINGMASKKNGMASENNALACPCDVADATGAEQAVATAAAAHGPARILVNCAGIGPAARIVGRHGPMPLAEFEAVISVNLIGTFNMLRLAAAQMIGTDPQGADGERGVIINTASIAAYEGQIGQAAYAASKGGIVALTIQSARELATHGIRVMTIAPGIVATPLLQGLPEKVQQSLAESVPFPKRLGRPEEFAQLVLAILANPILNGEVIRLDGALRMAPR
ncbi:MAG: SDR family NAD(P)-dependent oxidoreductase [Alphaproteobacteria bacterium]